jgi:probable HAF family extracellular repeat protein
MPDDFVQGFATGVYSFNEPDEWRGIIVGTYASADGRDHCFRTEDGLVVTETFPGKGDSCSATAISARLAIVGAANEKPGGPVIAFEWDRTSLKFLGALPGGNPTYSIAMAISAKDGAVGCSNAADVAHAVVWRGGTINDIGASKKFPGGTCANGINRDGDWIVGTGTDASGQPHAVRFEGGQVIPLESEVVNIGGWSLQSASAVNDSGAIVGNGMLNGEAHGFMLVP